MFHIILFQPEIPPNTGNILRLCANTGAQLHLIHPLGFSLNDKQLRRAGMDYRKNVHFFEYDSLEVFQNAFPSLRLFACSTKGMRYDHAPTFKIGDGFLFGPETRGLPEALLNTFPKDHILKIPMLESSRSLNLSNAAAVFLYEAYRQIDFKGLC